MSPFMEGLLLGRVLVERYRIDEVIGRGGMSVVYRATDTRLGREVALKVVTLPAHDEDERSHLRERFRREAGAAARIAPHPNVVQVYDYGTDAGLDLDFLVMELLRGRDLKALLRERRLEIAEGLRIVREAARGVAAGHRAGLVHRDVKPANIFLTGEPRFESVKILDFGIAKALEAEAEEELTLTGMHPHSPAYASPEQLAAERELTPSADVYQLGLVAYELFTGERPFTEAERERLRAGEALPLPARGRWSELPPALRGVIERALDPRPDRRFTDAAELAEALAELPADDATATNTAPAAEREDATLLASAPPPSHPPPPPRPARRARPTPGTLRAARLAAAGLVGVLALWGLARLLDRPAPSTPPATSTTDLQALEAEFRELYGRAHESLLREASARSGPDAAAAVQRVVVDLLATWVGGELERHLSHYADRVDFHDEGRVRRARIGEEREEQLERYPEREVTIQRQAVEFPEPGRARALVDRSWELSGPRERWTGAGRLEFRLALRDGRWVIVSEREVEVYRSERDSR